MASILPWLKSYRAYLGLTWPMYCSYTNASVDCPGLGDHTSCRVDEKSLICYLPAQRICGKQVCNNLSCSKRLHTYLIFFKKHFITIYRYRNWCLGAALRGLDIISKNEIYYYMEFCFILLSTLCFKICILPIFCPWIAALHGCPHIFLALLNFFSSVYNSDVRDFLIYF